MSYGLSVFLAPCISAKVMKNIKDSSSSYGSMGAHAEGILQARAYRRYYRTTVVKLNE